jgi:tetratricopeptide (TPR) repeat protein
MLGTVALVFLAVAPYDPRPSLVQMQLEGRFREALTATEAALADRPEPSRGWGLDYLRGYLLERLGREEAGAAFASSLNSAPRLRLYSRYRMALEHESRGHPEVAAGLIATGIGKTDPASPLLPDAVRLLVRTIDRGGDCRLLPNLTVAQMPAPSRRLLILARARCAVKEEKPELARRLLTALLIERRDDEAAGSAADLLAGLLSDSERGRAPALIGLTLHDHREFERASFFLGRLGGIGSINGLAGHETVEAHHAFGYCQLVLRRYQVAAASFGELARRIGNPVLQARALYHRGRSLELAGDWRNATASFRQAFRADRTGDWAAPALAAAMRLEWRSGNESGGNQLYGLLRSDPRFANEARRAALFLAVSDLVRGRRDRADSWLSEAGGDRGSAVEVSYWRGRLAELAGNRDKAALAYLDALRDEPRDPLAQAASRRLSEGAMAGAALALGRRLSASAKLADLEAATLLLPADDAAYRPAQGRLRAALLRDGRAAPFLRMRDLPVAQWPLWKAPLDTPEETLLALGVWPEGAPAVREHFPLSSPSLALTGARLSARQDALAQSVGIAESLDSRRPAYLPRELCPRPFLQVLYPTPARENLSALAREHRLDPSLLAALARDERLSPGLAPLRARFLAGAERPGIRLESWLAAAAARLGKALQDAGGSAPAALATLKAGEQQTALWRALCYSSEPEELLTKITAEDTRRYTRAVLTDAAWYRRLYNW